MNLFVLCIWWINCTKAKSQNGQWTLFCLQTLWSPQGISGLWWLLIWSVKFYCLLWQMSLLDFYWWKSIWESSCERKVIICWHKTFNFVQKFPLLVLNKAVLKLLTFSWVIILSYIPPQPNRFMRPSSLVMITLFLQTDCDPEQEK